MAVFAALHDDLEARGGELHEGVVTVVRMALTADWVAWPSVCAVVAAQFGFRKP